MTAILGIFSSVFGMLRRRPRISPSDQQLGDIGTIMDDDYYKRDILIAAKKISTSPYLQVRLHAIRDIGHFAWLGGPGVAKFASNHLMAFSALLQSETTPLDVKKETMFTIMEICACMRENQDKARGMGMLDTFFDLLDSPEVVVRRGATACLVVLVNENFENHSSVLKMPGIKGKLLNILHDDWSTWRRNEAARLILMLGLNRSEELSEMLTKT